MQLKQFTLVNYRKFGEKDNVVKFGTTSSTIPANSFIATTLLVGQNNAGKTTVVSALEKLCGSNDFSVDDFNYRYLQKCFGSLKSDLCKIPVPEDCAIPNLSFEMIFAIGSSRLYGIAPLLTRNEDGEETKLEILVKFSERQKLIGRLVEKKPADIESFIEILKEFKLKVSLFNRNGEDVTDDFRIRDAVDFLKINVQTLFEDHPLSDAYNSFFNHFRKAKPEFQDSLLDVLNEINGFLSGQDKLKKVIEKQSHSVNEAISTTMLAKGRAEMKLTPRLSLDEFAKDILKCNYQEGDFPIPESQYGAGYTSLLLIVSSILDHLFPTEDDEYLGKSFLVAIEEPESYMHPQMQKAFVTKIDDLMDALLGEKTVKPETQILITTHSPKILDGKLRKDGSFDNIDYIRYKDREDSHLANISDSSLGDAYSFILKHVKYQCPDLFFSDACVLVEGQAEETLLPFFIEQRDDNLSQFFLTIFSINGAYAGKYEILLRDLGIPSLIITDADPKNEVTKKDEKETETTDCGDDVEDDGQVLVADEMISTNATLNHFGVHIGKEDKVIKENICIVTQGACEIKGKMIQPTSFEEALILDNPSSVILKNSLDAVIPRSYEKCKDDLLSNSRKLQNKLSQRKADFSIEILFQASIAKSDLLTPNYISKGLDWLAKELGAKADDGE